MYKKILKPTLFRFNPELVHDVFVFIGQFLGSFSLGRKFIHAIYGYKGPNISKVVDGIEYRTPFLLSAGFDYNGRLTKILPSIGLGGVEVGSVTAKPCAGNAKPRLKRLPNSKSIVVNKGLKNEGVDAIIRRLKKVSLENKSAGNRQKDYENGIVGVSIARTNDISCADTESGIKDFVYSFKRLNEGNIGDYYTINISCPNVFDGESFTDPILADKLMTEIDKISCSKPVYIKMPINLEWTKFDELLKVLDKHRVNGVIIGNLNKDYSYIANDPDAPKTYSGGLSGEPCRKLSTDLIQKTREKYGKRFTVIGCGGVMSPEDAKEKFDAGADLIQLITGIIFEGPGLVKRLCKSVE